MVATDVASRGIGMIETPYPLNSNAQKPKQCFTLNAQALSRLRYFVRALSCLLVLY
jgi:hypothetical protein